MFPSLQRNKGLTEWNVCAKDGTFYSRCDEVPNEQRVKNQVKATMFAPSSEVSARLKLERCMRFLPHFHDSGGFFVCVLRKKSTKKKRKRLMKPIWQRLKRQSS